VFGAHDTKRVRACLAVATLLRRFRLIPSLLTFCLLVRDYLWYRNCCSISFVSFDTDSPILAH
jgi:hypothetical protein